MDSAPRVPHRFTVFMTSCSRMSRRRSRRGQSDILAGDEEGRCCISRAAAVPWQRVDELQLISRTLTR